jgi:flagellar protein FlaG
MSVNGIGSSPLTPIATAAPAAPAPAAVPAAAPRAYPPAALNAAVEAANRAMGGLANNLEFIIDEESKRTVVRVVNKETRQVIRQFPSDEMLSISHAIDRLQGLLIHQTA